MPATDIRKVSLRVAHSRNCPHEGRTALQTALRGRKGCITDPKKRSRCDADCKGCNCSPRFYPFYRDAAGKVVKGERFDDKQLAQQAVTRLQADLDAKRSAVKAPDARTFVEWTEEFFRILEVRNRRDSTRRAYVSTVKIATEAFGHTPMRDVGQVDLRRFVTAAREGGAGDSTISKHLRHLGAIFQAAVDDEVIAANPVPRFRKGLGLRVPRGTEPFTDTELVALLKQLAKPSPQTKTETRVPDAAYLAIVKAAATTGARRGELIAATWADLDLQAGILRVRRHRDGVTGQVTLPKDGEARDVYLIPAARQVFEDWVKHAGVRPLDEPIFRAPRGHYIDGVYLTKVVKRAMVDAGIPTADKNGRARKPFHALRATFARVALEGGRPPQWVQEQLGHSDELLTTTVYGRWSEEAKHAEAAKVGAFPGIG